MIRSILSRYSVFYPRVIVYMMQATEYQIKPYLAWYWRTGNFNTVMQRRALMSTRAAMLLLISLSAGIIMHILIALGLVLAGWQTQQPLVWGAGIGLFLLYPFLWAHIVVMPLMLGRWLIVQPRERRLIRESEMIFARHPGLKIAIAGSYGKTTMKELLRTVLSQDKTVAATPANKNVAISHAQFARGLQGDEDIVLIEYGEGAPGDVARFAATTHPAMGIITGLAAAHLDRYKTVQAAGQDIFSLAVYLHNKGVYVNGESEALKPFVSQTHHIYTQAAVLDWRVSDITVTLDGTRFIMRRGKETMRLTSALLGWHQVAPLALAAALAREFGVSKAQVETGVARTQAFDHRMQVRRVSGAHVIDDTYNGNIEGIRAGLALLKELPAARRKIYVTPGLVDQGAHNEAIHIQIGRLIADASPDITILMRHSVTPYIQQGLDAMEYKGEIRVIDNPLAFYTNLDQFVATGDVVLMQNDWTDNYF